MRLLIIGGSDAGMSAALRARELRPDIEVAILMADAFPNYSVCGLPFYVSGETPRWESLAHRTEFPGIELLCGRSAESIDVTGQVVTARSPEGLNEALRYDRLVIATGARPIVPETIDADLVHPLHTMRDSFKVHDLVESGKIRQAAVVGAGYLGLEMADALSHRGIEVDIVGRSPSVLPTVDPEVGELVRNQLESRQVRVHTGISVDRVLKAQDRVVVEAADGFSLQADLIVWATGVRPLAELAKAAGVETGIQGACKVTRRMETNVPFVYAAGDCVETWHRVLDAPSWLPLGTTAHKQGRVAGENAIGGDSEFQGTVGTQVVKVFDLAIARTGLLGREAATGGFSPATVQTEAYDHKQYYPGADLLRLRVTGDTGSERLLGAQIAGHWRAAVAKRIDVFATALFHRMKVDELNSLDLSYTPPLGSPWDAVQIAAQTWTATQRNSKFQEEGRR
jgi:NADPH-dependent 2,4-dienoyl-CoA reductase/sulfur reductase-like enzyme